MLNKKTYDHLGTIERTVSSSYHFLTENNNNNNKTKNKKKNKQNKQKIFKKNIKKNNKHSSNGWR